MTDLAASIAALDAERMKATVAKDGAALRRMLGDELIYTHSSARLDTKDSLIGNMESGAVVYTKLEPSEVKAQVFGETGIVTGVAQIGVTSNGVPMNFAVRFTDVWVRRNGEWQMVNWHSTRLR
ncbi:MAG: nuclear transport factor 2 family protein [Proteobacteria bacterium]|nr:nuclear transport factor 2 family protein [Pseudomonadota bacterium]